jgi:hypothetical protein
MIVLDSTLRKLEIVLAGAITTNQLPFVATYQDSTVAPAATNQGASNSTTAVTLVAAPASGVQRRLKYLSIYNADTVSAAVTVRLNDNATLRTLVNIALPSGSTLSFVHGAGWSVLPAPAGGGSGSNFISAIANKSANFTVPTNASGTLHKVTTGSSTIIATLPTAAAAGADWYIFLQKADNGAGTITTSPALQNFPLLTLMEQYDIVMVWCDGSNFYGSAMPASYDAGAVFFALMFSIASLKL